MSELDESRYMAAPHSGRLYEKSLTGFKQFFATEMPNSLPAIFAIIGAITISLIVGLAWTFFSIGAFDISPINLPAVLTIVSLIWGYGGWIHGTNVRDEHKREGEGVERVI